MIHFVVLGKLASMKNRRIPLRHRPGVTIPNPECRAFERTFMDQVPGYARRALGGVDRPLKAQIIVYYPSMRSDLDCAFVYDLLQKSGVVRNDRYIRTKLEIARIDKDQPRVEITIQEAT